MRRRLLAFPLAALSLMTMAFAAAPNIYGWDTGIVEPRAISQTSIGQAWINFVHHPAGGVLRVLAVVGIGLLMLVLVPPHQERSSNQGLAVA